MRQSRQGSDIMYGFHTPHSNRYLSNIDFSTYPLVKKGGSVPHSRGGDAADIFKFGIKILPDLIKAVPGITGMFKKAPVDEKQRINSEILKRINMSSDPEEIKGLYKLLKH